MEFISMTEVDAELAELLKNIFIEFLWIVVSVVGIICTIYMFIKWFKGQYKKIK